MPAIRYRIALNAGRTWDVRCAYATCAVHMQWSSSHTRHHTQWHRYSCAACASLMRHRYAVDTQHMRNSSAGDVPPNHLGDFAAYLFIFSYAVRAPWHRRPVEQGHYIASDWLVAVLPTNQKPALKILANTHFDINHFFCVIQALGIYANIPEFCTKPSILLHRYLYIWDYVA